MALEITPLRISRELGTPYVRKLPEEEFITLRDRYGGSSYYSDEMGACYFTYESAPGKAHFVLFDDERTLFYKIREAERLGVSAVFMLYREAAFML